LKKPDATFYPINDAGAWADAADDAVEKSDAGTGVTTTVLMIVVVDVPKVGSTAEVVSGGGECWICALPDHTSDSTTYKLYPKASVSLLPGLFIIIRPCHEGGEQGSYL
jgi:hypothetical protein